MLKIIMLMSAAAIAAPAFAQTAPPASTNAAQPAASAATPASPAMPAANGQAAEPATPAAPAAPAEAAEKATNPATAVASVVETDWAKYDTNSDGKLSQKEFGAWMTALREQNPAQKAQVKDVAAWTKAAFTQADKDKSGAITKPELERFLKG